MAELKGVEHVDLIGGKAILAEVVACTGGAAIAFASNGAHMAVST